MRGLRAVISPTLAGQEYIERKLAGRGEVTVFDTTHLKLEAARPFVARDARRLMAEGYVHGDMQAGWVYFAPDEAVLLSTEFAATHCFRVVRDKNREGQVGLSFSPVPKRNVSDIDGVLWLDERSAELREILFHFVNIGDVTRFKPGGKVHFRRMASGAWLVDDWSLRFPKLELTNEKFSRLIQVGYVEDGGTLVDLRPDSLRR